MAEKPTSIASTRQETRSIRQPWSSRSGSPFQLLERFADEMDRVFDDFGLGRQGFGSSFFRTDQPTAWAPDLEVFQRQNELVIKADLPGMTRDDVKIDIRDDAVTIQGERRREQQEEREGVYRSERSYGSFCRVVPLPEGAISEQAKATFRDGVLEITMPTPPEQVTRGRRLEITEGKK
jgi:HSP20 family protein